MSTYPRHSNPARNLKPAPFRSTRSRLKFGAKALAFAAFTSALLGQPYPAPASGPVVKKVLFFDDGDVLYRSGTTRVLHELKKYNHPGLITYKGFKYTNGQKEPARSYWESQIAWVSVYRKPNLPDGSPPPSPRYQMWFQGHTANKTSDRRKKSNVCYAYSDDGLNWVRPGLTPGSVGIGLYDFVFNVDKQPDGTLVTVPPYNPNDIAEDNPDGSYQYFAASETNIVMIGSGGYGERFANSVIVEPNDPDPNRRYKMIFYDWANTTSGPSLEDGSTFPDNVVRNPDPDPGHVGAGAQVAFSPDGIHWTKHTATGLPGYPGPAVLSRTAFGAYGQPTTLAEHAVDSLDFWESSPGYYRWQIPQTMADAFDVMYDPIREKYVAYGKMWVHGPGGDMSWKHAMGRIESADFINWSDPELLMTTGDKDADDIKLHTSPAFYYEGMYISLNQIDQDPAYVGIDLPEEIYIELMTSRDGANWDRNFIGQTILPRGSVNVNLTPNDSGYYQEFDSADIFTNSCPVVLDDEIRFYYGAYGLKSGVGLATAPRDRIVGLQARESFGTYLAGSVTLRKRSLVGVQSIAVNGKVDADGYIKVELLNRDGNPIPGYTVADADALVGDAAAPFAGSVPSDPLNRKMSWGGQYSLAGIPSADLDACFIRIHLKNAEVFSCSLVQ